MCLSPSIGIIFATQYQVLEDIYANFYNIFKSKSWNVNSTMVAEMIDRRHIQ